MNPRTWFRVSGSAVSAAVLFVSGSACLTSLICAQSSEPASVEFAPASFLSAPSLHLPGAPTSIATGDLNGDGKLDLVTTDWSSDKVTVSLGLGNGKFAPGIEYAAGSHPGSAIIADIDGDGRADVIVANQTESTIRVLLGSGNGKLQQAQTYSIGFNPAFIAVGDFNGDGKTDVAVSGGSSRRLAILLNEGGGSLGKPIVRSLSKISTSFAIADLNGDEHTDLALANDDGTISVLLGAGDGSFRSTPDVKVAQGPLSSILGADFNRDGKVDLAVTLSGEKQLSVLMGKGNGGFDSSVSYRVGSNPVSIALGDVDEDGIPDLVVTNQGSNSFSVLGGNADGTFRSSLDYVAGKGPLAAATGDFYGAGHLDLAIINYASQTISLPLGNGDGTFRAARAYSVELQPKAVAFGNLTGGKNSDLVVTNFCGSDAACGKGGTVSVMTATESGYRFASTYSLGAGPVAVALVDVDNDKNLDIVALNRNDKTISILLGLGGGSFQQQFTLPLAEAPIAFAAGDFNHDGKTDLAVLGDCGLSKCSQPGTLEILLGTGDGGFRSTITYPVDYAPTAIAIGDLNKDKNLDIVISNSCGKAASCTVPGTATVFLGNASGKFAIGKDVALGNSPSSVALGDLSGRDVLDLLVTRSTDNSVAVLHGVGDGTFQTPTVYKVGVNPGSVAVADFNGDGKLDVAVGNIGDSTVSVLFGKGDGTLLAGGVLPVGPGPESLTAIQSANSTRASLVTANGNSASSSLGTDITVLANVQPEAVVASSTALASSVNPSDVNQFITLTATVTGSADTPTGKVEFLSDSVDIPGCASKTLDGAGKATCTIQTLIGGSHTLDADYGGEPGVYSSSASADLTQTVTPLAATLDLTSSSASPNVGQSVTFTAAVTASTVTPINPSGTVTFTINNAASIDCPPQVVDANGKVTCTTKALIAPSDTIGATYAGDPSFTVARAASLTQSVATIPATLALTASSASVAVNNPVTFTVTVTPSVATELTPAGTVTFLINGTSSTDCPAVKVNSSGKAFCTTKALTTSSATIKASYSGDPAFTASNSPVSLIEPVTKLPATLTMTASPSSSTVDQSVTFTTGFSGTAITPTVPMGTVSFTVNNAAISDCPSMTLNASGQATCTTSSLIYPADKIVATYAGDSNFSVTATSGTATIAQTVTKATAQTTVTSSSPTSAVNQSVTFKATVVAPGGASAPIQPTGSVTFAQGSTTLCTSVVLSSANPTTASCSYIFTKAIPSPGAAVTATFSGDSNFLTGTPSSTTQIVGSAASKTTIAAVPNPSTVNQQVTFTANVTTASSGSGTAVPSSGNVVFTNTSAKPAFALCAPQALTAGTPVTCNYTFSAPGSFNVIASFTSTDTAFGDSVSDSITQQVGASGTSVTLTSAPTNSDANQQVTLTAVVNFLHSGTTVPTGTMNFLDGLTKKTLCSVTATKNTDGSVSSVCVPSFDTAGAHPITASFVSDAVSTFQSSSSSVLAQIVNQTPTSTTVGASIGSAQVNQPVTFTATTQPTFLGSASPTGTVTFTYKQGLNTGTLCTTGVPVAPVTAGSAAACTAPLPLPGSYTITATYSGDGNFGAGNAATVSMTVNRGTSVVKVVSSAPISVVDQSVTFTATLTPTYAGSTVPSGSLTFTDATAGSIICGSVTLQASTLTATCTVSSLTLGAHSIAVTYSGDTDFLSSASSALSQVVQPGPTAVILAVTAPAPPIPISVATQSITVTATVRAVQPGNIVPTGAVKFTSTDNAANHCSAVLLATSKGVTAASCTVTFPATDSGNIGINAQYLGDANFTTSSTVIVQSVQNFTLGFAPSSGSQSGPILITQSSSNTSDKFHSVAVNATSAPIAGFADTLILSCVVKNSTGAAVADPSCAPNPGTLANGGVAAASLPYTFSASATAPVGQYTIYLTGADSTTPQLIQAAPPVTIEVVSQAGSLSLAPGAIGTEYVTFNTAAASTSPAPTLQSFECGTVVTVSGGNGNNLAGQVTCSGPSGGVPVTGQATTVSISVATQAPTSVTASSRTGGITTAAFWSIPLLALLAWFSRRGSPRRNFFRFLGMIVLLIGIGNAIGCGSGGFTRPPTQTGGATSGSYLVQVVATDSNGVHYYAVVPLVVQSLQSSSTQ
jgi:hypothetical protein